MPAKRTKEEAAAYMKKWRAEQKHLRMAHRATTPSSMDGRVASPPAPRIIPPVDPAKVHLACDATINDLQAEVAGQAAIILYLRAEIERLKDPLALEELFGD